MGAEKTIVLVVHGVGEQLPAATIDSLVGAATEQLNIHGRVSGHTELLVDRELPKKEEKPDENPLSAEVAYVPPPNGKPGQMELFPCAIRRTKLSRDNKSVQYFVRSRDRELLAAEVFWADLSMAPHGLVGTVRDLLHTVLALGYLALDNFEQSGRDDTKNTSKYVKFLIQKFVFSYHAMIAPINLLMLAGVFALLFIDFVSSDASPPLSFAVSLTVAIYAICTVVGTVKYKKNLSNNRSLLAVNFWMGFRFFAFIMVLIGIIISFVIPDDAGSGETYLRGIAVGLVSMMIIGWGISLSTLIAMILLAVLEWILPFRRSFDFLNQSYRNWRGGHRWGVTEWARNKREIHISICSAMMILWTLFSASFWTAFAWILSVSSGTVFNERLFRLIYEENMPRATATLSFVLAGVVVLSSLGIALGLMRHGYRRSLRMCEPEGRLDIWIGRVILNPAIGTFLLILILYIGYGAINALVAIIKDFRPSDDEATLLWLCYIIERFCPNEEPSFFTAWAPVLATVFGIMMIIFRDQLSAALGIVRDVTTYSIRSFRNEGTTPHYPVRADMLRRFNLVLYYSLKLMPEAKRLIIIAHSQGSMIATAALCSNREPIPKECYVVTVGSPFGHIYRQYFPAGIDIRCLWPQISYWLNIYRCDDYIGASIREPDLTVDNVCIGSGGHTNYWTDIEVWKVATDRLRKKIRTARRRQRPSKPEHRPP